MLAKNKCLLRYVRPLILYRVTPLAIPMSHTVVHWHSTENKLSAYNPNYRFPSLPMCVSPLTASADSVKKFPGSENDLLKRCVVQLKHTSVEHLGRQFWLRIQKFDVVPQKLQFWIVTWSLYNPWWSAWHWSCGGLRWLNYSECC